jgi:hypothetical protein
MKAPVAPEIISSLKVEEKIMATLGVNKYKRQLKRKARRF